MLSGTFRYCSHMRCINPVISITSKGLVEAASTLGYSRNYSQGKGSSCKDIAQSHGKRVEPWPKSDPPPPAWRTECPYEPQPPNYDPYRIKVPDIACPPLPPSNVKETTSNGNDLYASNMKFGSAIQPMLDLFQNSPVIHPDYWRDSKKLPTAPNDIQDPLPRLGYHGKTKYKYAFHEPWKPLDRLTLLSQAEKEELEGQTEDGHADKVVEIEKC